MTERELKPCPFCGGRAAIQQGGFTKYVMCLKCEVMGPNLASDVELIDAWNRRTTPDREAIIEECISVATGERLEDEPNCPEDEAYNVAVDDCVDALKRLKGAPNGEKK